MASTRQDILKMIEALPDDVTLDDVMAELYFRTRVDEGLRQLDSGQALPHSEVKGRLSQWLAD